MLCSVVCAQLWPVCALPKRRLTSAAAAALATCRKLTESTARRNKLVWLPMGRKDGTLRASCNEAGQSRDKDKDTQISRRRPSQSVAVGQAGA